MKWFPFIGFLILILTGCQKENISFSTNANDIFFLDNQGASMKIMVQGNTSSKKYILFVHGGPGSNSELFNTDYISGHLENKYACVYWDQRDAGASQGGSNGNKMHLSQYADDLKKVIRLLKYRYGSEISVYLLGHSFGGLVTSDFLTAGDNQDLVKAWICVDGSHNYPLNDTLTHDKLLTIGRQQIALNNNVGKWSEIVQYCKNHNGNFSPDESNQLETYAEEAEGLFPEVNKFDLLGQVEKYVISQDYPLTSMAVNYLYSSNSSLNSELATANLSPLMNKIHIPIVLFWGRYDFICPEGLAYDIMVRTASDDKKMVFFEHGGHNCIFQEEEKFCNELSSFIDLHP